MLLYQGVIKENEMDDITIDNQLTEKSNVSVLKEIFDKYVEDTISEEKIRRVLKPIYKMIHEGMFDRPRRRGFFVKRII